LFDKNLKSELETLNIRNENDNMVKMFNQKIIECSDSKISIQEQDNKIQNLLKENATNKYENEN
jgi:hypothetical protein